MEFCPVKRLFYRGEAVLFFKYSNSTDDDRPGAYLDGPKVGQFLSPVCDKAHLDGFVRFPTFREEFVASL